MPLFTSQFIIREEWTSTEKEYTERRAIVDMVDTLLKSGVIERKVIREENTENRGTVIQLSFIAMKRTKLDVLLLRMFHEEGIPIEVVEKVKKLINHA